MTRKLIKFDVNPLLSGPSFDARSRSGSPYRLVPINDIDVDPDQPRRVFESESIAELAASIKEFGLLCPILVKLNDGGTYRLISGERRLRACKLIGMEAIPAVLDADDPNLGDSTTLAKQLVENIQRQDLTPMERALAMGQLKERFDLSIRDIAKRLSVSKSLVQRSLELLGLPDDLQAALISGLAESKALLLAQIGDREARRELLEKIDELSRSQLEVLVEDYARNSTQGRELSHGGTDKRSNGRPAVSGEDLRLVEDLQKSIGSKVVLQRTAGRPERGRLIVEFYSAEDLDDLYRRLS